MYFLLKSSLQLWKGKEINIMKCVIYILQWTNSMMIKREEY